MSDIASAIELASSTPVPDHVSDGPSGDITAVRPSPPAAQAPDRRQDARRRAVEDLLTGLDALVRRHATLPVAERDSRLSAEAERITAEVARQLARARAELGRRPFPPSTGVDDPVGSSV